MTNRNYNVSASFAKDTLARAETITTEFDAVATGFTGLEAEIDALAPAEVVSETQSITSAVGSVAFSTALASGYDYELVFSGVTVSADDTELLLELSDDGGTSYKSANFRRDTNAYTLSHARTTSTSEAGVVLGKGGFEAEAVASFANNTIGGSVFLYRPYDSAYTAIAAELYYRASDGAQGFEVVTAEHEAADAINALRITASGGNLTGGDITLRRITA